MEGVTTEIAPVRLTSAGQVRCAGPTIADRFATGRNAFDLLRLLAAIVVLVSHSWPVTGNASEPFSTYLGNFDTGGGWAVSAFFVMSGFLVTRSVESRDAGTYLAARAWRILPGLALATLFETFIVGPAFFPGTTMQYFEAGALWHLQNVVVFGMQLGLPGVFTALPVQAVNSSLWTLPGECACYLVLLVPSFSVVPRRWSTLILLAVTAVLYVALSFAGYSWNHQGGMLFSATPLFFGLKNMLFFFTGSVLWLWRADIPLNGGGAIAAVLLLVAARGSFTSQVAYHLALPYLTLYAALAWGAAERLTRRLGDLSYGTYLFAFPVQQCVEAVLGPKLGPWRLAIIALAFTLPLAWVPWHAVERRALQLKAPRARLR
jgi:peptidoglycan/LPS O-acetylase OafA/YrhL